MIHLLVLFAGLANSVSYTMKVQFSVHSSMSYGFEAGGQANISVRNADTAMIFGLITMDEYEEIPGGPLKMEAYCGAEATERITKYQTYVESPPGNKTLSLTIEEKGVYMPFYMLCYDVSGVFFAKWDAEYSFRNTNGWLDYRWHVAKVYEPILIGISVVILVGWLINWLMRFTLKIKIHFLLTGAFISGLALHCIVYLNILVTDAKGSVPAGLTVFGYICNLIYNSTMFSALLLAVNGWYIVRQSLDMKKMTAGWAYLVIYLICLLITNIDSGMFGLFMAFVGVMCLFGYLWTILRDSKETIRCVLAHLMVIRENGIDPKTTPIYRKYALIKLLNKVVIGYLSLKALYLMFTLYASEALYYNNLIDGLIDLLLWIFIAWIFHLRKDYSVNYLVIDDNTGVDVSDVPTYSPAEYQLQDLENMTIDSPELDGGLEYVDGTPLPPQPMVVNSPTAYPLDPTPRAAEEQPVTVMPAPPQNPYDDEY